MSPHLGSRPGALPLELQEEAVRRLLRGSADVGGLKLADAAGPANRSALTILTLAWHDVSYDLGYALLECMYGLCQK